MRQKKDCVAPLLLVYLKGSSLRPNLIMGLTDSLSLPIYKGTSKEKNVINLIVEPLSITGPESRRRKSQNIRTVVYFVFLIYLICDVDVDNGFVVLFDLLKLTGPISYTGWSARLMRLCA